MIENQPLSVLFVCTANICRSPYMELLARHLAPTETGLRFSSAGTMGMREEPMDPTMAAQLVLRGASAEGFRSRRATGTLVEQADVVLTGGQARGDRPRPRRRRGALRRPGDPRP